MAEQYDGDRAPVTVRKNTHDVAGSFHVEPRGLATDAAPGSPTPDRRSGRPHDASPLAILAPDASRMRRAGYEPDRLVRPWIGAPTNGIPAQNLPESHCGDV